MKNGDTARFPGDVRIMGTLLLLLAVLADPAAPADPAQGGGAPPDATASPLSPARCAFYADFGRGPVDLVPGGGRFDLRNGCAIDGGGRLEFTAARQEAELDEAGTTALSPLP